MPIQEDSLRTQILHAAIELYYKFGLKKVAMDDIAKAIGKSRSSLYYYYKNRDEVFQAVLHNLINEVIEKINCSIHQEANSIEKLRAFCIAKVNTNNEKKAVFTAMELGMSSEERSAHQKIILKFHYLLMEKEAHLLQSIIDTGIIAQDIRSLTLQEQESFKFIVQTSIRGIRREMSHDNDYGKLDIIVNTFIEMISPWLKP
ncbi:TetR/AcrR family transcriptional regulator [Zhouia sp. PK063]|uniref:TetR/AcrR family transcriptional regulator n=1 Tax=Zhouia sp. PK063 TaxID=3373602 RepID=UPI0037BDA8B7